MSVALRQSSLPSHAGAESILRPAPALDGILDFDQFQRYEVVAQFVDRLCRGMPGTIRILEVGCNVLNHLERFVRADRVEVIRCDVIPGDPEDQRYIQIEAGQPMPFADASFDAVVAVEVLEHVPEVDREGFIADCLRVCRHGMVLTCPDGRPDVEEAERIASNAYLSRHGSPHPFLKEHVEFGLPREDEVRKCLQALDVPHAVVPNAPLDLWLSSILLTEGILGHTSSDDVRRELVRAFRNRNSSENAFYRRVYVCAKSFDATAALEGLPAPSYEVASFGSRESASVMNHVAESASQVVAKREADLQALPATLESVIRQQEAGLREQELRFIVLNSYVEALEKSWPMKLLSPLRWLRKNLRPRGIQGKDLLPWTGLLATREGGWRAVDNDPQFVVACCLPAGWMRVRIHVDSEIRSEMHFYAEERGTFQAEPVGRVPIGAGETNEEHFFYLARPTRALRIDPLDDKGRFRIERLEIIPRPAIVASIDALRRKLRLLRAYRNTLPVLARGMSLLLRGRWREVAAKWQLGLDDPRCTRHGFYEPDKAYQEWIDAGQLTDSDRAAQKAWALEIEDAPRFSVLMPTYNTPEIYLRLAIESVLRQTYPHWELCIADDGSTDPSVRAVLEEYAAKDDRILVAAPGQHGGISATTNAALAMASGDYVALLDHDDEIAEHALDSMARSIVADPTIDMLYSDEDKLQPDGLRRVPFFKPDWSPTFFLGCMYTCHLGVYRTAMVREIGGFRSEFDGAQDYDLVLRLVDHGARIAHVPDVLYHWRLIPGSTATSAAAKPEAHLAARRAIQEHLDRCGLTGHVDIGPSAGLNFTRFDIVGSPLVSIIIPSTCRLDPNGGDSMLERCVGSILEKSRYRNFEVFVVDRHQMPEEMLERLSALGVRRITYDEPFNWSKVNNLVAAQSKGSHLLFLNDDTEVVAPDWLEAMLEFSQQKSVGAVGAKLHFPDGGLQHVGVTILDGRPGHPFYGYPGKHTGYFARNVLPHEAAAVTGACLMTRRDVFEQAGGFDESFPLNYNDVDYCLRVRQLGLQVVYTPHARLTHHESLTKPGVFANELDAFRARWGTAGLDPYYNPNLNTETFDYRIAKRPPRS